MKICLKTYAKQSGFQHAVLNLHERLPERIASPCALSCDFYVENCTNYFLITFKVSGTLDVICQRCLLAFPHEYHRETQLAICTTDALAETLMEHYECIVAQDNEINLTDILTDELYLYSPEKHEDPIDCDSEINQLIGVSGENCL